VTLHSILKLAEVLGVDPGELVRSLRAPEESRLDAELFELTPEGPRRR